MRPCRACREWTLLPSQSFDEQEGGEERKGVRRTSEDVVV